MCVPLGRRDSPEPSPQQAVYGTWSARGRSPGRQNETGDLLSAPGRELPIGQEVCENSPKAARTPSEHPKPVSAHALDTQETRGNANSAASTTFDTLLQLKRAGVRHAATHPRPRTRNGTGDYTAFDDALW